MKFELHPYVSRAQLIMDRTRTALRKSGLNVRKFADAFAQHVVETIPAPERVRDFYVASGSLDSALRAEKLNAQIVNRYMTAEVPFPADFEELWIDCLPEPHRAALVSELAARYGLLGAKIADAPQANRLSRLADVLTDAGDTVRTLGPILADGKIGDDDAPNITPAREAIKRMLADLTSLDAQLASVSHTDVRVMRRAAA